MGIPLLTSGEACSGPGPGRKQWEQRWHSHSRPEERRFLKSATQACRGCPARIWAAMLRSRSRNVAAPRYNAGRWALGADGPIRTMEEGKQKGSPGRGPRRSRKNGRVAFPYNRGRQLRKDLRDQLAKSFTVFKKNKFHAETSVHRSCSG